MTRITVATVKVWMSTCTAVVAKARIGPSQELPPQPWMGHNTAAAVVALMDLNTVVTSEAGIQ